MGRRSHPNSSGVLKDLDFHESGRMIHLGPERKWFFMEQVRADAEVSTSDGWAVRCIVVWARGARRAVQAAPIDMSVVACFRACSAIPQFLEHLGIMDYSLLLGIHVINTAELTGTVTHGDSGVSGGAGAASGVSGASAGTASTTGSSVSAASVGSTGLGVRLPTAEEYRLPSRLRPGQPGCTLASAVVCGLSLWFVVVVCRCGLSLLWFVVVGCCCCCSFTATSCMKLQQQHLLFCWQTCPVKTLVPLTAAPGKQSGEMCVWHNS